MPPLVRETLLVDLDEETWRGYLDNTERWLDHTLAAQAAFREQADDLARRVHDPQLEERIGAIARTARTHEEHGLALYQAIDREPARVRRAGGVLVGKARAVLAGVVGLGAGGAPPWRDMQQLLFGSLEALNAFAACEQLGYALGLPALAEPCREIVAMKQAQHLLLQQSVLETVPWGILYEHGF